MLTGTLTLDQAVSDTWDALVVGAGPGGALAARQLALAGLRTLLVERHEFPRKKVCGGCLNGRALEVLRTVGLESAFNTLLPVELKKLILQASRSRLVIDLPAGAVIQRSSFDALMVQEAIDSGAAFLPETHASVEQSEKTAPTEHTVCLRQHSGACRTAKAKVIVAADGLGHPSLNRLPIFACRVESTARIGIGTTVLEAPAGYRPNTIHMAIVKWGYVGLAQTSDGTWNLAAAIDPKVLKQMPDPTKLVANAIHEVGLPELPSLDSCVWQGTPPLTRQSTRLAADRIFLLGDAAGYMEPFTGEGMGWALASAIAVVPAVIESISGESEVAEGKWDLLQRRKMQQGQTVCRVLSSLLRRPTLVAAGLHAFSVLPSLVNPLVRRVHARPIKARYP